MKHLLQYFSRLSLDPKNAEELKGLILQLAVQGKLTHHWRKENPDVEDASILLERIKEEKARLVKEGRNRKQKEIPPIKPEEVPFEVPGGWVWCRLGNITFNRDSERIPLSREERKHRQGAFDYYGASGVIDKIDEYLFDKSLLLIGEDGANLINRSTPIAFIAHGKYWVNNHAHVLDSINLGFLKYLCLYINAIDLKPYITGTAQPKMNQAKMNSIFVPLPPIHEQKAIVKIVNQLFAEVEQLETLTKERIQLKEDFVTSALQQLSTGDTKAEWAFLQEHFSSFFTEQSTVKKLRESILQLAVQGKLTQHWRKENPDVENASILLERIKEEKAQLIKEKAFQKPRQSGNIEISEFDNTSPTNWVIAKIVDLCFVTKLAGFEYTKHINLEDKGEIPVIRAQNVKMNRLDERKLKYIDRQTSELLFRCALTKPCLLMTFIGAGIGDVALFSKKERWHLAPNVAKLEPFNNYEEKISLEYLLFYLMSPQGQKQIFKYSKATAQPSLSMGTIRDAIITLPPYKEQKAIVEKVNALMDLCDQLEQAILTSKATQEDWMKSSLREVFETKPATISI